MGQKVGVGAFVTARTDDSNQRHEFYRLQLLQGRSPNGKFFCGLWVGKEKRFSGHRVDLEFQVIPAAPDVAILSHSFLEH
jgi:hypothetical protein